jgi:putative membrane protein
MKEIFQLFLKGMAMGAANIIPGVSGGTIALITGIFERLINAIKSLNFKAFKFITKGEFKEFAVYTDFWFLLTVFSGVGIAILSLARLFEFLFADYPVHIWSYFFGLILASVYFVGKTISRWTSSVWVFFILGAAIALSITFMTPATENRSFLYLVLSGVVAVSSMILPGISGSFVLILLGNYQLVAIEAINNLDFSILMPVLLGMVVGLIAFSHFLSWLFKSFKDLTISTLTGFIFGSLGIIWPWKEATYFLLDDGQVLIKDGKAVVERYQIILPEAFSLTEITAILLMFAGIITIWLIERNSTKNIN